jgi:hypothetical protein
MRPLLLPVLLLAACTVEAPPPATPRVIAPPRTASPPTPPPRASNLDTRGARAAASGLSADQLAALVALDVPVYVPTLPSGWRVERLDDTSVREGGTAYPGFLMRLRSASGACLDLDAASEGLGDVFVQPPPRTRELTISGVATIGPVVLGWSRAGDTAEGWETPHVSTEWFGMDGMWMKAAGGDGCAAASADDTAALLATLRPLDPADDALSLGVFRLPDLDTMLEPGPDPEALARQVGGPTEAGEGRQRTVVETLRRRNRHAVVLVTTTDAADDSIRDVRTRVALMRGEEGWVVASVGTQVRCQRGRGHQEWSAEACR